MGKMPPSKAAAKAENFWDSEQVFMVHFIDNPQQSFKCFSNVANLMKEALDMWVTNQNLGLKFHIKKDFNLKNKKKGDNFENINISLRPGGSWTNGLGKNLKRVINEKTANMKFGSKCF
jgi:hypothetical protein